MAGFEGDGEEGYFFFVVYEVGGEHDVGEVVVFGKAVDVFFYQVCVHQAEGGVGIRDFYSEDQAEEKADCVFYEFSGFSLCTSTYFHAQLHIPYILFPALLFRFGSNILPAGICV